MKKNMHWRIQVLNFDEVQLNAAKGRGLVKPLPIKDGSGEGLCPLPFFAFLYLIVHFGTFLHIILNSATFC